MSVCSLDWGAISTILSAILASIVAWYISEKWNDQKGSEVISLECKNLWYELDKLSEIYTDLEQNPTYRGENHNNFYSGVKDWQELNISKINLIESLLKDSNKNIDDISLRVDELKAALSLFKLHYMTKHISVDGKSTHDLVDRNKVLEIIDATKKSLIPFIIYRKN